MVDPDLELVFERLGHGILRVDHDLTVVEANNAVRRHFYPARLVVGRPLPEPWPDVSLADVVRRAEERPEVAREERRAAALIRDVQAPEGRLLRVTAFAVAGSPTLLHVEDRTAAEQHNRNEREFLANAAHELLTPLTGIVTAAFALEAGAKDVPEDRDRFIAHIASYGERLSRTARALLVVARAQSGQQAPRLEALPLRPLLERAVADADPDHESTVALSCAPDIQVFVDRDLAEQAFTNLLANAGRHAGGGGITVSADEVGRREVGIVFADGGGAIAPERLDHLGDRFHTTGGPDGGGFGLGVSIAAQAIELLGGTLTYASSALEGTSARVRLRSGHAGPAPA